MQDFKDQMLEMAKKEWIERVEEYLNDIWYSKDVKRDILDFINRKLWLAK